MRARGRTICIASLLTLLAGAVVLPGCGGTTTPAPSSTVDRASAAKPAAKTAVVDVYFMKGNDAEAVKREVPSDTTEAALQALLAGPSDAETQAGYFSPIPEGTRLLSYRVESDRAIADFSSEMLEFGGGSQNVNAITDEISETVMANDRRVKHVDILVAGVPSEESLQP